MTKEEMEIVEELVDYSLIRDMFKRQDELNEYTVPNWRQANLPWHRAMWLECAEAVDSTPWKWWKKGTLDEDNFKVEMVDIWHFLMSYIWVHKKGIAERPEDYSYLFEVLVPRDDVDIVEMIEDFVALLLEKENPDQKFLIFIFANIWSKLGFTFNDLYREYIIKNCLNKFRQDNGYKEGTYIKMWTNNYGEKVEDNVIAWSIADKLVTDELMFDALYEGLGVTYTMMNKEG